METALRILYGILLGNLFIIWLHLTLALIEMIKRKEWKNGRNNE